MPSACCRVLDALPSCPNPLQLAPSTATFVILSICYKSTTSDFGMSSLCLVFFLEEAQSNSNKRWPTRRDWPGKGLLQGQLGNSKRKYTDNIRQATRCGWMGKQADIRNSRFKASAVSTHTQIHVHTHTRIHTHTHTHRLLLAIRKLIFPDFARRPQRISGKFWLIALNKSTENCTNWP